MRHRVSPFRAGRRAASLAAATFAVGVLLSSCSSAADSADADSSDTTTAESTTPAATAADASDTEQITALVNAYADVINSGRLTKMPPLLCEAMAYTVPEDLSDQPPPPQLATVDAVEDITVDGAAASASVTISDPDDPSVPKQTLQMEFANEGGWKVCE